MEFNEKDVINVDFKGKLKGFSNKLKNILVLVLVVLMGIIVIFNTFYRLQTGTVAVITRFGEIRGVNEEAGIHTKVPFIDEIKKVDVQTVYKMEYGYRTENSGSTISDPQYSDENYEEQVIVEAKSNNASIVLLNLIARYQVNDPINYLYEVDDLEGTMRLALEDTIRSTMQVFSTDEALENKQLIDEAILPTLQKKMDKYHSGIKILQVTTQNVSLLPAVEETRQKVEEANQYKKGRQEEAQKYANTVKPKAEAEAIKLYEDAKGYRAEVVANAKADVVQFEALYSQYVINPQVVKEKYYIEAMQQVLQNNQLLIDQSSQGNLLKFFNISAQEIEKVTTDQKEAN